MTAHRADVNMGAGGPTGYGAAECEVGNVVSGEILAQPDAFRLIGTDGDVHAPSMIETQRAVQGRFAECCEVMERWRDLAESHGDGDAQDEAAREIVWILEGWGRTVEAARIDHFFCFMRLQLADPSDPALLNAEVGLITRQAGAVD